MAIGAKKIETRSWSTSYRGPLAIHAAKGFPRDAQDFAHCPPVSVLFGMLYRYPRGAVIATCRLSHCVPADSIKPFKFSEQERRFGDYSSGRFAWILEEINPLAVPVPAKGALGLWEWEPPA